MDDRPIRVDFDWGFKDGRQFGRGRSGGQVLGLAFAWSEQLIISLCILRESRHACQGLQLPEWPHCISW